MRRERRARAKREGERRKGEYGNEEEGGDLHEMPEGRTSEISSNKQ